MTEQQKEALEILNRIRNTPGVNAEAAMTDEQYFKLLDFIFKPEVQYVPQVIPQVIPAPYPVLPGTTQPYYGQRQWEITCKID